MRELQRFYSLCSWACRFVKTILTPIGMIHYYIKSVSTHPLASVSGPLSLAPPHRPPPPAAWPQSNPVVVDRLILNGEGALAKYRHPDPYTSECSGCGPVPLSCAARRVKPSPRRSATHCAAWEDPHLAPCAGRRVSPACAVIPARVSLFLQSRTATVAASTRGTRPCRARCTSSWTSPERGRTKRVAAASSRADRRGGRGGGGFCGAQKL